MEDALGRIGLLIIHSKIKSGREVISYCTYTCIPLRTLIATDCTDFPWTIMWSLKVLMVTELAVRLNMPLKTVPSYHCQFYTQVESHFLLAPTCQLVVVGN